MSFEGKCCLVTGGSSGIGKSIVESLASEKARVFTCAFPKKDVDAALEEWQSKGYDVQGCSCDVSRKEELEALVQKVSRSFGGNLHVLVSNAGIAIMKQVVDTSDEDYEKLMSTNLKAAFDLSRLCHPMLKKAAPSSVIVIGSIVASRAVANTAVYAMTKASLRQLIMNLACVWAPDHIRVNCIAPGAIDTPFAASSKADKPFFSALIKETPMKRMGRPEEIASVAVFLSGSGASFIIGQNLYVDGGFRFADSDSEYIYCCNAYRYCSRTATVTTHSRVCFVRASGIALLVCGPGTSFVSGQMLQMNGRDLDSSTGFDPYDLKKQLHSRPDRDSVGISVYDQHAQEARNTLPPSLSQAPMRRQVFTCARTKQDVNRSLNEWRQKGFDVHGCVCDVTKKQDLEALVQKVSDRFDGKLHALVSNVGRVIQKRVVDYTDEEYDTIFSTNLRPAFDLCRLCHPLLKKGAPSSVVFIGSFVAGRATSIGAVHSMTKASLSQLTMNLACEWALDEIRVNCIAPGGINTPAVEEARKRDERPYHALLKETPMKRLGQPGEIAAPVLFFCSPDASFITGQNLYVDGGISVRGLGL